MTTKPNPLVDEIDAFVSRVNMSAITFGREVLSDPHFVRDLRRGRRTFRATEDKVRTFIAEYVEPDSSAEQAA